MFKVMFDRTRDWADVEAMLSAGTLDPDAVKAAMLAEPDVRFERLDEAARRASGAV